MFITQRLVACVYAKTCGDSSVIDLTNETVMPLADAAARLPKCRNGKPPHYCTVSRWASRGIKGVKLETIVVGATTCTSLEAMQRFCERRTDPTSTPSHITKARQRELDKAERELAMDGI